MKHEKSVLSKNFPEKLKRLRSNRGWSQGQLAKKIGIEANRVSRYERGVLWPTLELLVRIAQAMEVSVDYLIRDEENIAINKVRNQELLKRIEEIDLLPETKQVTLITVMDAFIKQQKFEKLVQA